jgi:hypothetical protein
MTWKCKKCGATWPALTTFDAYAKHKRANDVHPGESCKAKQPIPNERMTEPCDPDTYSPQSR